LNFRELRGSPEYPGSAWDFIGLVGKKLLVLLTPGVLFGIGFASPTWIGYIIGL
jgi:hypothetical protein